MLDFAVKKGKREEAVEVTKFAKTICKAVGPGRDKTQLTGNHKEMLGQWQAEGPHRVNRSQKSLKVLGFGALFLLCCRETGGQGKGRKKGGDARNSSCTRN